MVRTDLVTISGNHDKHSPATPSATGLVVTSIVNHPKPEVDLSKLDKSDHDQPLVSSEAWGCFRFAELASSMDRILFQGDVESGARAVEGESSAVSAIGDADAKADADEKLLPMSIIHTA